MLEFKLILNSFFGFSEMLTPDDFLQVTNYPKKDDEKGDPRRKLFYEILNFQKSKEKLEKEKTNLARENYKMVTKISDLENLNKSNEMQKSKSDQVISKLSKELEELSENKRKEMDELVENHEKEISI